jgi:hypothetical protein
MLLLATAQIGRRLANKLLSELSHHICSIPFEILCRIAHFGNSLPKAPGTHDCELNASFLNYNFERFGADQGDPL